MVTQLPNPAEQETPPEVVRRILIVDDHALVRHGLTELISGEPDLEVCAEAADMDEALKQVEQQRPDLVVVDISLQDGNGLELIKRIKAKSANVTMIVVSMHDETLFAERALKAGAMGYINKQEATDQVIDAIRQVLTGHIYLSDEMKDRVLYGVVTGERPAHFSSIEKLSDRELEVFELIGRGFSTRQIATKLHLSIKTIETHREHIKEKLGLKNASELNQHAVRWVLEISQGSS